MIPQVCSPVGVHVCARRLMGSTVGFAWIYMCGQIESFFGILAGCGSGLNALFSMLMSRSGHHEVRSPAPGPVIQDIESYHSTTAIRDQGYQQGGILLREVSEERPWTGETHAKRLPSLRLPAIHGKLPQPIEGFSVRTCRQRKGLIFCAQIPNEFYLELVHSICFIEGVAWSR